MSESLDLKNLESMAEGDQDIGDELYCGSHITVGGISGSESRFLIQEKLSIGGSGEVWLAYDEVLCTRVALKIIHDWFLEQPSTLSSLRAEVIAGRKIHSQHVLKVHDLTRIGRKTCLVMSYVEGKTLNEFCRDKCFTTAETYLLSRQLCEGVAAIHGSGFAHCDLNPSNVLVETSGNVVIVDLGLASLLKKAAPANPHRAPELGRPCFVLSDVYALGSLIRLIAEKEDPRSPLTQSWLQPVIDRCLSEDPKLRFLTASEVMRAIDNRWFSRPTPRWWSRKRIRLGFASILLSCAGVFCSWSRWQQAHSALGFTQCLVITATDPRSRFIADLASVYLESQSLAVTLPPAWLDESIIGQLHSSLQPTRLNIVVKDGGERSSLTVEIVRKNRKRTFAVPLGLETPSELVSRLSRELSLNDTGKLFRINRTDHNLEELVRAWQTSEDTSTLSSDLVTTASVPLLLLRLKLGLHRYASTKDHDAYESATSALTALSARGVVTSQTVLWHAALLRLENNSADSVQVLQNGLKHLATTAPIYRALSDIELRAGFAIEALQLSSQGVARDPYSPGQLTTAARAHIALGQDNEAIRCLLGALALNDLDSGAHTALGNLYILLERFHEGAQQLERALEVKPSADGYAYFGLAQILSGKAQQGLLLLRGTAAKSPTLYSLGTLGAALRWDGDLQGAAMALRQALQVGNEKSRDAAELGRLAVVHAQLHEIRLADELLELAGKYGSRASTELIYDTLIVDAFAERKERCLEEFELLKSRRFPVAFLIRDPQVSAVLNFVRR